MKIIFLDIDGVLNSWGTIVFKGLGTLTTPKFNEMSVQYLKSLVDLSGAKVVIHSSWAITYEFDDVVDMFVNLGFDREIFLPLPSDPSDDRAERIHQSIDVYTPDKFIVIDDRNMEDVFGERMVHIDQFDGFSYRNMLRAKTLMDGTRRKIRR